MMGGRESKLVLMDDNGIRCDGRKVDETRRISIKAGVLRNANGSAYIEFGDNKIIAGVYGPRDVHPKHMSDSDTGILRCRYHMTPFSVGERKNPAPSRREIEISKVIKEALLPAVMLEKFPRTAVDVYIEVLQADGGTRCAALDAASVALADAGIPMRDMVCAPVSILPRSRSDTVINGSRVRSKFAMRAATMSPLISFEARASALAVKSRPNMSLAGRNPT